MKVKDILEICEPIWIDNDVCLECAPRFSVLLPTFRRAKSGLFEKCITSVLGQTFHDFELIIIDDASTDGTSDIIKKYMKIDRRVKCIRHTYNVGLPAISEYEAYTKAKGSLITFIFDDCVWEKDFLQQVNLLFNTKTISCCYSLVKSYYGDNENDYILLGQSTGTIGKNKLSATNYIANSGVVLKREIIEDHRCGLYDPHLAQTRLCDWSLWKRIDKYYTFYESGIMCGCEYGAATNDSLGKTYEMHSYTSLEREVDSKTIDFSPAKFDEIEIDYVSDNATQSYKEAIESLKRGFCEKKWYLENNVDRQERRIIYYIGGMDASEQLSFEAFAKNTNSDKYIFKFTEGNSSISDILQADAVICSKYQMRGGIDWLKICNDYDIPCYYFADDNFEVLAKDCDIFNLKKEAQLWKNNNRFDKYSGIIVSSQELKDFFINQKNIQSEKVFYLPCMSAEQVINHNQLYDEEQVTFAYMGESWRNEYFVNEFLPVIDHIASEKNVRLIIPNDRNIEFNYKSNLEIIRFERELYLPDLLRSIRQYKPNFLIHCGPEQANNKYKTVNALFNALSIGSVLITNDIIPYNSSTYKSSILCIKDVSKLEDILKEYPASSEYWGRMYNNARMLYEEQYGYRINETIVDAIFKDVKNVSKYILSRRIEKYILCGKNLIDYKLENNILVNPENLRLSKTFYKSKRYVIKSEKEKFSSLSFIFSSFDSINTEGVIIMSLIKNGKVIRKAKRRIEEIENNQWLEFIFEEVNNSDRSEFVVQFQLSFQGAKKKYGVYELSNQTSFLWRFLNYINLSTRERNVILFNPQ